MVSQNQGQPTDRPEPVEGARLRARLSKILNAQEPRGRTGPAPAQSALAQTSLLAGSTLVFCYAALLLASSVLFYTGHSLSEVNGLTWALLLVICAVYYTVMGRRILRLSPAWLLAGAAALALIVIASLAISTYFFDISWDGRDYHQKAIVRLAQGWNPVRTELEPREVYYNVWLNHYPKGSWISAAWFYQLTGQIETGKSLNLLAAAAVFLVALSFFLALGRWSTWQAALLSLILAANPVTIYQSLNFYIDGQVSSLLLLACLLLLMAFRHADLLILSSLVSVLIVGLNLKFTATAYLALAAAVLLLANLVKRRSIDHQLPLYVALALGGLLGCLVVGYNPYLTNWNRYGHPFYPTFSRSAYNIDYVISNQMPDSFIRQNPAKKLFISVFSRSKNITGVSTPGTAEGRTGPLKPPFSVTRAEIRVFRAADVRIGGWGPLFGAIVLLAGPALALSIWEQRNLGLPALGLILLVGISLMLNSESWWARYSPQLWAIAPVALSAVLASHRRPIQAFAVFFLVVILANLALIGAGSLGTNLRETARIRERLAELAQRGEETLVYYGVFDAVEIQLQTRGIPYRVVGDLADLPCPQELEPGVFYSFTECPAGQRGLLSIIEGRQPELCPEPCREKSRRGSRSGLP